MTGIPFDAPEFDDHESVIVGSDAEIGLRAFVAIHSTARGPALGGCRMVAYPDGAAAYRDALRLSQAMSYKNALAGLPHGGGKAVIWADPTRDKSPELLRAMGSFIASAQGRYITAGDVGISVADLDVIGETNPWTTGRSPERGGAGDSGILTAFGVWQGMRAAAEYRWGSPSLTGRTIGVIGAGKVGRRLAVHLITSEDAHVIVTDPSTDAIDALRAELDGVGADSLEIVDSTAEVLARPLDVLSPNALGGILTHDLAADPAFTPEIVCGGANNQLAGGDPTIAGALADRGLLYAPDYLVNCGGVVQVADELLGFDLERARERVAGVYDTTMAVLERAAQGGTTPLEAAAAEARERIAAGTAPRFGV